MATVRQTIERLKGLRARLANPAEFYRRHAGEWMTHARGIANAILSSGRPADVEPAEWNALTGELLDSIGARPIGGDEIGTVLFLGGINQAELALGDVSASAGAAARTGSASEGSAARGLSLGDVAAYVEAGMRGDPMGKSDIDERDAGKSPEEVAFVILRSIRQGNVTRAAEVRAFLERRGRVDLEPLLKAVLEAWREAFLVRAVEDYRRSLRV